MAGEDCAELLDLSGMDVRVRSVLRRMNITTVGGLLSMDEDEFLSARNCGPKITAKILQLQAEYGKDIRQKKPREAIGGVLQNNWRWLNKLIAVALVANDVVDAACRDVQNRYYVRITTKRFNMLKRSLEALGRLGD